ncbi:hypothetical protein ACLOJK_007659 [Asimina triloba]
MTGSYRRGGEEGIYGRGLVAGVLGGSNLLIVGCQGWVASTISWRRWVSSRLDFIDCGVDGVLHGKPRSEDTGDGSILAVAATGRISRRIKWWQRATWVAVIGLPWSYWVARIFDQWLRLTMHDVDDGNMRSITRRVFIGARGDADLAEFDGESRSVVARGRQMRLVSAYVEMGYRISDPESHHWVAGSVTVGQSLGTKMEQWVFFYWLPDVGKTTELKTRMVGNGS